MIIISFKIIYNFFILPKIFNGEEFGRTLSFNMTYYINKEIRVVQYEQR